MSLCRLAPIELYIKHHHLPFHKITTTNSRGNSLITSHVCVQHNELVEVAVVMSAPYDIQQKLPPSISQSNYSKPCWQIASSAGMGAGTFHGFPVLLIFMTFGHRTIKLLLLRQVLFIHKLKLIWFYHWSEWRHPAWSASRQNSVLYWSKWTLLSRHG